MAGFMSKLKGATAEKGSRNMIMVVAAVVVAAVGYSYFNQPEPPVNPSRIGSVVRGEETIQGGNSVDPQYRAELQVADQRRADDARASGTSSFPTIVDTSATQDLPVLIVDDGPDPLPQVDVPDAPVISQKPVVIRPQVPVAPAVTAPPTVQDQKSVTDLGAYISGLRRAPAVAQAIYMHSGVIETPEDEPAFASSSTGVPDSGSAIELPLAGTVLYGELIGRVNSDSPGPVLARILQGPYAGARLIGGFQTGRDSLVISFTQMSVENDADGNPINETVPIQSVAVDTRYIGTAMATKVNRHMAQKIAFSFISGFAQGLGRAVSQTNGVTTTTSDGTVTSTSEDLDIRDELLSAGGEAVSNTGQLLYDAYGNRPTTIIVEAGTPIGVLFY
ncbi:TrbI/VirB10 family protein [Roseibium sp. RKSG952]|uniref:TrbI/VirB10 family protein n=1 Tax=Roseibium sp. RKSG952 TaxID=2529384 RepID=UPI0012BC5579|nr:TrbI/VirB10 family protein [Roseibium sp. RKSG952]MTH96635.1 hypothetical protein [Roseibium sp. RKSG952]